MNKRTKKMIRKFADWDKSSAVFWSVFAVAILLQVEGNCATAGSEVQEIEVMTTSVMNTIFSPWVKKIALVFGGGAGLFQAFTVGSVKPLLLWGGLGLAVNYVPKIIQVISGL